MEDPSSPRGASSDPRVACGLLLPASWQRPSIATNSSTHNGIPDDEDDVDPLPTKFDSRPITPSPRCKKSSTLHANSGGWMDSNASSSKGKRIGYDGTTHTPSVHLLKPTASSLGHRVHKSAECFSQQAIPLNSLHSNPTSCNQPFYARNNVPGGQMTTMSSPLDPFDTLNKPTHSKNAPSDHEDMTSTMEDFEFDAGAFEEVKINQRHLYQVVPGSSKAPVSFSFPSPPKAGGLQRCSTWSPGCKTLKQSKDRAHNPVAMQLLRECEEEIPAVLIKEQGECRDESMTTSEEESPTNLTPIPHFSDVSDRLVDVKIEDNICLTRPVPRKLSGTIPAIRSRRSSLH